MTEFTYQGALVYLPGDRVETSLTVSDGVIADIGGPAVGDMIDARGLILAPALLDVHGDVFERQVMPRPGVFFPMETAGLETDRQLAAIARLDGQRRADRSTLWPLVSSGPARAMRLTDRGEIAVGKRADLVLVTGPPRTPPRSVAHGWWGAAPIACRRQDRRKGPSPACRNPQLSVERRPKGGST